jgi:hypothetical protein
MQEVNKCLNCIYWSRYSWDDKPLKIGVCTFLENDLNYWEGPEVAHQKIVDGKIGADNLYTHESFGCIHFNKSNSD